MSVGIEISRRLAAINSASSVARKVLVMTVMVWLQQYLVRHLSLEEYALFPVLMAFLLFFPLATNIFTAGLRRYITDAYAKGDEETVSEIVSTMTPILAAVAGVLLAAGLTCAYHIDSLLEIAPGLEGDARFMFTLLIVGAAFRVLVSHLGLGFHLRQRFLLRNVIGLGAEILRTVLLFALLFGVSLQVKWVVVSMVLANVLELLVVTKISFDLAPALRYRLRPVRFAVAGPLLTFGGWSLLTQISLLIRESADMIILNKLSTETQVTAFAQGSLVDTHVRHTYFEATSSVQPAVTAMNATGQDERLRFTYHKLCRYSLWALMLPTVPVVVFRHELVDFYLQEKAGLLASAATVMALLMARVVVIFPNATLGMIATAKAELKPVALRACAISVSNLLLTLYLVGVRDMGAVGSALSTVIVTAIGAPALFWTLGLRLTGSRFGPWFRRSVWPGLLPGLVALPVWALLQRAWPATGWLTLGVAFAAGALVYAAALVGLAMRPDERADLWEVLGRLRSRTA